MSESAAPGVARFLSAAGVVGGGALLPGGLVLTCAHVVNRALGRLPNGADRPSEAVSVDFPLQGVPAASARVVAWCPLVELGQGDVAVVALDNGPPSGIEPLAVVARAVPPDEALALFGFPLRRPAGVWKGELRMAGPLVGGWQQLLAQGHRDYKLQAGFSGCPIFDVDGRMVGVFAQADKAPDVDVGASIPASVAAAAVRASGGLALLFAEPEPAPSGRADAAVAERVALPEIWHVPPLRNLSFTGRDGELAALANTLGSRRAVALTGLGGVGKSQLAVQYVHRYAPNYQLVWWVTADRTATLVADLASLAARLGLTQAELGDEQAAAEAARRALERRGGWLLVFDNAPDPQLVRPWLPQADYGQLLITSRFAAAWGAVAHPTPVRPLEIADAARLLQQRSGQEDPDTARALAEQLEGLPLALDQAGAYMEATGMLLIEYLTHFRSRPRELLAHDLDHDAQTVATIWELAFEEVRDRAPAAADLLTVAAFLAPHDIPRDLFVGDDRLPDPLRELRDALAFAGALAALARYSLVTPVGDAFAVHRLVQAVTRDRLDVGDRLRCARLAQQVMAAAFPSTGDDPNSWPVCERRLAHALAVTEHAAAAGIESGETANLLDSTALYVHARAQLAHASSLYERAMEIKERIYGPEDPALAGTLARLGNVLSERPGGLPAARERLERALAIYERAYGPNDAQVASTLSDLAIVLRRQSRLAEARQRLERALAIYERAYGQNHAQVASTLSDLAIVLRRQKRLADARPLLERALEINEAEYGPEHLVVARTLARLGDHLRRQGDLAPARRLLDRALAIYERAYGPDHPRVASTLARIGVLLRRQGDLAEARRLLERALVIYERAYGPDHFWVARTLRRLGDVLEALHDVNGAQAVQERARRIRELNRGTA